MATETQDQQEQAEATANGNGHHPEDELAARRSIADLADGDTTGHEEDDGQVTLLPVGDTLSLKVGGKKPTDSEIKIRAIPVPITGQVGHVSDDESYVFLVQATIQKVEFTTKRDGDGNMRSKKRTQIMTPSSVQYVTAEKLARIQAILEED